MSNYLEFASRAFSVCVTSVWNSPKLNLQRFVITFIHRRHIHASKRTYMWKQFKLSSITTNSNTATIHHNVMLTLKRAVATYLPKSHGWHKRVVATFSPLICRLLTDLLQLLKKVDVVHTNHGLQDVVGKWQRNSHLCTLSFRTMATVLPLFYWVL